MIGGKAQSQAKPTAMGSLVQASTYGQTIPSIYGTTQATLLAIWAANIRAGMCNPKKGKSLSGKKKGPPQYVENIDFLIGSNPIAGFLQGWSNGTKYPLVFNNLRVNLEFLSSYTIPDPNFYAVIAVTMEISLFSDPSVAAVDDYGGPGPRDFTNITTEYPLWNSAQAGPDLIDPSYTRILSYNWSFSSGATIDLSDATSFANTACLPFGVPPNTLNVGETGFFHIYYASLSPTIHHHSPANRLCLTFEPILGDGPEYDGFTAQQILYPQYAGAGSPDIDLGSSGAIPNLQLEVMGSYGLFQPRGDASFCDMIEDVVKSGQLQVGSELGLIQRGVNLNSLPGPIQKNFLQYLEPAHPAVPYRSPNIQGNILVAFGRWRPDTGVPTISDDAANTWIPIYTANEKGFWYVNGALAAPANNKVTFVNGASFGFNADAYIFEMDPNSQIDSIASSNGVGPGFGSDIMTATITTSGAPGEAEYILGMYCDDSQSAGPLPYLWNNNLFATKATPSWSKAFSRIVYAPGTYTVAIPRTLAGSAEWAMVLIAFKPPQPSSLPATLGNIIDFPSLNQVRAQCQANGLWGSAVLNSQKTCADWLSDLYKCADAAPVWSGFVLKSIPRSEVSLWGNGALYISPTNPGPVATLTESDLIADSSGPLITVERKAQVDSNNILQVQYYDRTADYNPSVAAEPLSGAIALFGPRKESPMNLPEIQDPLVARMLLAIEVRRYNLLRNTYKFKMKAKWAALEAMDLILINDSQIGINNLAVRLTSIKENDQYELECEAELFVYGCNAPQALPATALAPFNPNPFAVPAPVNVPIIFEPPLVMCLSGSPEIWCVVSDSDPDYGGSIVYVSTDGGVSYGTTSIGTILGNATQGFTVGDWPSTVDPDTTADLHVDLTESNGFLGSLNAAEEAAFEFPCYVAGGLAPSPTFIGANDWYVSIEPGGFAPVNFQTGGTYGIIVARTAGTPMAAWLVQGLPATIYAATIGASAGTGFAVGDLLNVTGGGGSGGVVRVATVSGSSIASLNLIAGGAGYVTTVGAALSVLTGSGSGSPTANISAGNALGGGAVTYSPVQSPCCPDTAFVPEYSYCGAMSACEKLSTGYTITLPLCNSTVPGFTFAFESFAATFANAGGPASVSALIPINSSPAWSVSLNGATFSPAGGTASYETGGGSALLVELQPLTAGNPSLFVAITSGTGWSVPPTGWFQVPFTEIGPVGTPGFPITMFTQIGNAAPAAGYELMEYLTATLTGPSLYTMPAGVGGPLRRSCFGVPLTGTGADHPDHSAFAWLNSREVANVPGILKVALQPAWIGTELFFKFVPFNVSGQTSGIGDIADAVPYPYTPTGSAFGSGGGTGGGGTGGGGTGGGGTGGGGGGGGTGGGSGTTPYSITGGALTQPTATTIHMADAVATFPKNTANYNARTFTIPTPTVPTTYYITIADPTMMGDVGTATSLVATAQTSNALVGAQGNTYIGSIVVVPGGGGTTTGGGGNPAAEEILINGV